MPRCIDSVVVATGASQFELVLFIGNRGKSDVDQVLILHPKRAVLYFCCVAAGLALFIGKRGNSAG